MTSSGTYNFALSTGECVLAAYDRVNVHPTSIRQEHMLMAHREMNLLLVEASNRQVNLFKVEFDSFTLTRGVASYTLPAKVVLVLDAYITTNPGSQFSQSNRYITPLSRTQYASLSNPNSPGAPTQYWLDRLASPVITFWPVPDNNGPYTFGYYRVVQMQDANLAGGETPDVIYRWLDWFVAGLAHRFSRKYAPSIEKLRKADKEEAWQFASAQDTEAVNLSVAPSLGRYYPR